MTSDMVREYSDETSTRIWEKILNNKERGREGFIIIAFVPDSVTGEVYKAERKTLYDGNNLNDIKSYVYETLETFKTKEWYSMVVTI